MDRSITIIAPYEELKNASEIVLEETNIDIETAVGDLWNGVEKAKIAKTKGKEIIISRGGTAKLIKENVDISVIEIKVTGYDLLRVLNKYVGCGKRIAVVGYSNVISGAKAIGDIIGLSLDYFVLEREEEAFCKINEAADIGIDVVIGDAISVKTARELGLKYDLIKSGKEAIKNAIDEAIDLYQLTLEEREKKRQLKAILDFSHEGIIAVNKDGVIQVYNHAAEKVFKMSSKNVIGKKIDNLIPNTRIPDVLKTGEMELGSIQEIDASHIVTNRVPIIIKDEVRGVVATFQDITKIQDLEQKIRKELSQKGLIAKHTFDDIIGSSEIIKETLYLAKKYSMIDSTVHINGESGTGKELFAQAIHNNSNRSNMPFIAVNCAALPSNLLESELFGYQEGAFTGARKGGKQGLFELAHNGTIFLDEISEMDIGLQSRLLRVIQEREVMRIGDDKIIPVDVRIIVATNKNLRQAVEDRTFREDLYYRLNVLNLIIPPLRERKDDIKLLLDFFLKKFSQKYNSKVEKLNEEVIEILMDYSWPGNIRELQNIVEKISVICEARIATKDTCRFVFDVIKTQKMQMNTGEDIYSGTLKDIERKIIEKILKEENYNKTKTARRLGIDRGTICRKLEN
ncbi:MAG: sigma 54-interacting transcriptional regulator [Clostridia bacterium]|nr:sigma 54-interacting transcriptional regulator [Clostridia bacterium]